MLLETLNYFYKEMIMSGLKKMIDFGQNNFLS